MDDTTATVDLLREVGVPISNDVLGGDLVWLPDLEPLQAEVARLRAQVETLQDERDAALNIAYEARQATAERDTLAAELDRDRHEYQPRPASQIKGWLFCRHEGCHQPEAGNIHRTSRVVLAEHAEGQ